jgi:hypothetical protein
MKSFFENKFRIVLVLTVLLLSTHSVLASEPDEDDEVAQIQEKNSTPAPAPAPAQKPVPLTSGQIENYFVDYDSIIENSNSLSENELTARRFLALRAHISNYSAFCERYSSGSDLINRVITKWNGMSEFLIANDLVLGGPYPADVILTSYSNRASLKFSNLGPQVACRKLKSHFEYFMKLDRPAISNYTSTSRSMRLKTIKAGAL